MTAAVKPTPDDPLPVVYTPLGETIDMYFNNYDLATPGSPINAILISPLIFIPSCPFMLVPLTIYNSNAFFTSSIPKISGAIDPANKLNKSWKGVFIYSYLMCSSI